MSDKNNKKVGTIFEKICISYLSDNYSNYEWKETKSSWDGNRDFVELILETIWGEAKYKKDSTALTKKDIDPTLISGIIDNKVELIFIITNGTIPKTIQIRVNEIASKEKIRIVFITSNQLQYWFMLNPKKYSFFFKQPLPKNITKKINAVQLTQVSFIKLRSIDFCYPEQVDRLFQKNVYKMQITIDANCHGSGFLNITPHIFSIPHESSNKKIEISIQPGIQFISFLVIPNDTYNDLVNFEISLSDGKKYKKKKKITVIKDTNQNLIYNQQEKYFIELSRHLTKKGYLKTNSLFNVYGKDLVGKTFLLEKIVHQIYHQTDCSLIRFSKTNKKENDLLICKIILFLNFPRISYQLNADLLDNDISYLFNKLKKENLQTVYSNIELKNLLESITNANLAQKTIISLLNKNKNTYVIERITPINKVLLLDNFDYLDLARQNFLFSIFNNIKNQSNNIQILYTSIFRKKTIALGYELKGMTYKDIENSISDLVNPIVAKYISKEINGISNSPAFILNLIKYLNDKLVCTTELDIIKAFTKIKNFGGLLYEYFEKNEDYIYYLDIIYRFENGLHFNLLNLSFNYKRILNHLAKEKLIILEESIVKPINSKVIKEFYNYLNILIPLDETINWAIDTYKNKNITLNDYEETIILGILAYESTAKAKKYMKSLIKKFYVEYDNKNYPKAIEFSNILYRILSKKEIILTSSEIELMFYHGICMIHCDKKRQASQIFLDTRELLREKNLLYFRITAEIYNNKFWRFECDYLIEALDVFENLKSILNLIKDYESINSFKTVVAMSTCLNRIITGYLLIGNVLLADLNLINYEKFIKNIDSNTYNEKYKNMLNETYMDYARGISIINYQKSVNYYEIALSNLNEKIDKRRYIVCKIDYLFLKLTREFRQEYFLELNTLMMKLKKIGYKNEAIKAFIRKQYILFFYNYKNINYVDKLIQDIYDELLIERFYTHNKTELIVKNLLAALYFFSNKTENANLILSSLIETFPKENYKYYEIIEHNLSNLGSIKYVAWAIDQTTFENDTYILDVRIW